MPIFTTLYIIRHGQSEANEKSNILHLLDQSEWGEFQSPLTSLGHQQAKEIAKKLRLVPFEAIFSSDLNRTRETAELLAKPHGIQIVTNSTIRERNFGTEYPKLPEAQRSAIKNAVGTLNDEEKMLYRFSSDGETAKDAIDRFETFLKEIIPLYNGKTIAVINHGNIMRMFLIHIGWATYDQLPSGSVENTGYFVLKTDGKTFQITKTIGIKKR